uniref:Type 2 DNA topoisomerase 6 subunit B-like n=1 Tax=Vitis vinifera TaxID=29760 RepID=F6HHV3_VITVI
MSEDLCRLSVVLKRSPVSDPPILGISISDTGVGSCLEEFKDLRYSRDWASFEKWVLLFILEITGICDREIHHYHLNLKESVPTNMLTELPSKPKNGAKFSGTEISLSTFERMDDLLAEITHFFRKVVLILVQNIAIELVIEHGDIRGSRYGNFIQANECNHLPSPMSNIECLKSGLEDFVCKHGNSLNEKCFSCFPNREHLKVGSGLACRAESQRSTGQVLCFYDFSPCAISQSSMNALISIDWKNYGLTLRSFVDQNGSALLEWEDLPTYAHIDIVLHCYHKQYPLLYFMHLRKTELDRNLIKKAVKLALDDLKAKYTGLLLSAHALKICSYAPDLARSITGLILSSSDSDFQKECLSLLGLQSQEVEGGIVEDRIKEKIISVVEINDRKPQRSREAPSFLFENDCIQEQDLQAKEYEGEEAFNLFYP